MNAPKLDPRARTDAMLAAMAIGVALPTSIPGYEFLIRQFETHGGWARSWLVTVGIELALAICGGAIGALAVLVKGRGLARWTPVVPCACLTLVGGIAAIVLGAQNSGYGEAGIAVLVAWVVGGPLGVVMQMICAAIVWALALGIGDAARDLGRSTWITVGGVVLLHVVLKAMFPPLVFGVIAAVLGLALAVRRQNGFAIAFFAVLALAGVAFEVGWMFDHVREQAELEQYLREQQSMPDPS